MKEHMDSKYIDTQVNILGLSVLGAYPFLFFVFRVAAVREEQRENFYSRKLDPHGAKHPMVRVQLLAASSTMLGKLLTSCIAINEQTSQGIQKQTLPLSIMTVRKTMRTLTQDQVEE